MSLATIRDLAIILLAVESLLVGVVLILLVWQMASLSRMLRQEIKPILESVRETMGSVRGTTTLISETVVAPLARTAGVITALGVLLRLLRRGRK
ncbi:MAG: hypothetical protein HYX86_04740 [Chloroflexi bacterium]|nr:hypothetical protein [Chloroflexota bacterium]